MNLRRTILDFVFPRRCEICSGPVDRDEGNVCSGCLMRISFLPVKGCCSVCSRPVEGFDGKYVCDDCRGKSRPHFDRSLQAVRLEGVAHRMVVDFKFRGRHYLAVDFAMWMEGVLRASLPAEEIDVVVPVPLKRRTLFERGYNQSELLSSRIAESIDRLHVRALVRTGHSETQSSLDARSRRINVKGTFEVSRPSSVRGRTVLLVDDIMTTGSTLSEASRMLKKAGAARVWCITVARSAGT